MGGVELKDKLDLNAKISYYGELNNYFSKHVPDHMKKDVYMPKWEDDEKWQKIHKRTGKIDGKGTFATYQEMRDACYELVKSDKDFRSCTSSADTWCTDCTRDKSLS